MGETQTSVSVFNFGHFLLKYVSILREINSGNSRNAKSAILTQLEALNFDFYEFLYFLKAEIYQTDRIQSPKICQKWHFIAYRTHEIDFT